MEDKKISKDAEYASLRQEILDSINACDVYNIAMYTITITALGAAFTLNSPPLFLLPYIVLFPFQRVINKKKDATIRLGAYISVYHECGEGWESNVFKYNAAMNKGVVKPKNESLLNKYAGRIGSVQLAILSSMLCIVTSAVQRFENIFLRDWKEIIAFLGYTVLSIILAYLAWKHNQWNKRLGSTKSAFIRQLKAEKRKEYFMKNPQILTGYPSIDKPWLKYYPEGAWERATNIPENCTVWDVIEKRLIEYRNIPAIEYFGRKISRDAFRESVYEWAKAFRALGVRTDEVVVFYGPFFPEICAMTFAMNVIGATAYFLKLAISPEALEEETKEARFTVVYDAMWDNVKSAFTQNRFEKVILVSEADDLPPVKKALVSMKKAKGGASVPRGGKNLRAKEAPALAASYTGAVKADFVPNRSAFITSSSGTTVGGVVKGCVASNESTIAQLYMSEASDVQYYPGDKCLVSLPPTASTSLNCLFLLTLYMGMTAIIDPRVSEEDFYYQIVKLKPSISISTGSIWETFFYRVEREMRQGKKYDFSFEKGWTVGGEGTDIQKFKRWDEIVKLCSGKGVFSGYGQSELFSAICVEKVDARYDYSHSTMSVGIPYAGIITGIFDANGKELGYNERGELWIKSNSIMKEYYNKPELTAKTLVDGWVHTGDLASIDENGFLYIYGRLSDCATTESGEKLYLFDIAEKIKAHPQIDDALVLAKPDDPEKKHLLVHFTWNEPVSQEEKDAALLQIDAKLRAELPRDVTILGYAAHEGMLPYSPTTLKKDRNKMAAQKDGYLTVRDGKIAEIEI